MEVGRVVLQSVSRGEQGESRRDQTIKEEVIEDIRGFHLDRQSTSI